MRTLSILLVTLAACSSYSPKLPEEPFLCGTSDPKCPDGYSCEMGQAGMMVCVVPNGTLPDGGSGSNGCDNDSNLEPNNNTSEAFNTTVDSERKMLKLSGLAICPAGDIDMYAVTITTEGENIQAIVAYDANGAPLQMAIADGTGSPIKNASSTMANTIEADVEMAAAGQYYVQVAGPTTGSGTNNYELTINVTGP